MPPLTIPIESLAWEHGLGMLLTHVLPLALSLCLSDPFNFRLIWAALGFIWGVKENGTKNMARIFTKKFLENVCEKFGKI